MAVTYITDADLEVGIRDLTLSDIKDNVNDSNTADAVETAKLHAIGKVKNYLKRYDLETEFEKVDDERNLGLVSYLVALVLYKIWQRVEGDGMPEYVAKDYNDATDELQQISKGKMEFDLALKEKDTDGDGEPDSPVTQVRHGGIHFVRFKKQHKTN